METAVEQVSGGQALIRITKYQNTTMKKQLTVTEDYTSPSVEIIDIGVSLPLCVSGFQLETQKYEEVDIWSNN